MRVAVLGGTISGTVAARHLAQKGLRVDLFRNLNDPKRSISNVHPLCEYQTATFVLPEDAPREFAEEVEHWLKAGLIQEAPDFRFVRLGAEGEARGVAAPGRRFLPRGGCFALLDALISELPASVTVMAEQLVHMCKDAGQWWLRDRSGKYFGPYEVVLFAFDALPRAARKASQKQLLESALPETSAVIASSARAQMASCMSVVLQFDSPLQVPYDTIVFEGVPELQFAARNPKEHQQHRGLSAKHDTWTVVATPAWSLAQRPDSKGKWDKTQVGKDMVRVFCTAMGVSAGRARQLVPTFHWEGCSYINKVLAGPPCAFDSQARVGWCGDMFGGLGPAGAVVSGCAASGLVAALAAGRGTSALPRGQDWGLRQAQEGDEDIVSIVGPFTGRREPDDGLDHTWETGVRLARGSHVDSADSYKRFRKCGPLGDNRPEGPWQAPPRGKADAGTDVRSATLGAVQALRCNRIDDGLWRLSGLSTDLQSALLSAVFPEGAQGVCGGLYDAQSGEISCGVDGTWSVHDDGEASWTQMGLHGRHVVGWEQVQSGVVRQVIESIKAAAPTVLKHFSPDCVRVSFENMRGRVIRGGQTLCGWSRESDRIDSRDDDAKVCVVLGRCRLYHSYKYRKEDRDSLDVELKPGDVLIVFGSARGWVSAVTGCDPQNARPQDAPFDFAHVWFLNHSRLQAHRPDVYNAIHHPPTPHVGSSEYKWMQFAYTMLPGQGEGRDRQVMLRHCDSAAERHAPPEDASRAEKSGGGARRWRSKRSAGVGHFEQNWTQVAGA